MCVAMQYFDVVTNPRWRTAAISKIAKSPYLSEKLCDFDQKLKFLKFNLKNRFFWP